jgi:hypothetical protein
VKGDELKREIPDFNREHFLYHLSRADYNRSYGSGYKEPGPGAHIMAVVFKVMPKVGPLGGIDFKEPTPKTEDLYFKSVNQTIDRFGQALRELKGGEVETPNMDLDTGKPTKRGEYPLADYTYREWLDNLRSTRYLDIDPLQRGHLLTFWSGYGLPPKGTRIDGCIAARWVETWSELNQLRSADVLEEETWKLPRDWQSMSAKTGWVDAQVCGE